MYTFTVYTSFTCTNKYWLTKKSERKCCLYKSSIYCKLIASMTAISQLATTNSVGHRIAQWVHEVIVDQSPLLAQSLWQLIQSRRSMSIVGAHSPAQFVPRVLNGCQIRWSHWPRQGGDSSLWLLISRCLRDEVWRLGRSDGCHERSGWRLEGQSHSCSAPRWAYRGSPPQQFFRSAKCRPIPSRSYLRNGHAQECSKVQTFRQASDGP